MDLDATRFFCQCGRLLNALPTETFVSCPTCQKENQVPGQTAVPPPPPAPGGAYPTALLTPESGTVLGHYRLGRPIGRGGMGTVHEATDERDQRRVAVKILHATLQNHDSFVTRFRREARAAARLNHPHIVQVLDYGVQDGVPYLVMELLEGEDLLQGLRKGRPATEAQVLSWMLQAAAGLRAAAHLNITHRDVKPTNIVLVGSTVKIADFGLAKATDSDSHLTLTGEVLGTPHYMSPEQGRGTRVDHRSDLYSLGATFYHLLAGQPVFSADSAVAVIMKHLHEEPAPLRRHAPQISPGLEQIIHRLLQKNPADRYQDYDALIRDLESVSRGGAPSQGAIPPSHRIESGKTTFLLPEQRTQLLLRRAGGIRRVLALFLDLVALELLLLLVAWTFSGFDSGVHVWHDKLAWQLLLDDVPPLVFINLALALLFLVASDASGGRSIGKRWLRLRVCRQDGRDLGGMRALLRAILVLPGILGLSPTLAASVQVLMHRWIEAPRLDEAQIMGMGVGYLLVLWALGRVAGGGRPVHDLVTGAEVYRAQALEKARALSRPRRAPSPRTAFLLSALPGIGLMYAGRIWAGLLFMVLIPVSLGGMDRGEGRWPLTIWLVSAVWAAHTASRRTREALARGPGPEPLADPSVVHRQES